MEGAKQMNYGQGLAIMILVGEVMQLTPLLIDEAKGLLQDQKVHPIMARAMEKEAIRVNDQLRHDASLIAMANSHADRIKSEYGLI